MLTDKEAMQIAAPICAARIQRLEGRFGRDQLKRILRDSIAIVKETAEEMETEKEPSLRIL